MRSDRRHTLMALALAAAAGRTGATASDQAQALSFPRDFGAHLNTRIEWWYVTGSLHSAADREFGFQITFFRSRMPLADQPRPVPDSPLAATHLLFAHAALTDVQGARLRHAERMARWNGLDDPRRAQRASTTDTDLHLDRWSLRRQDLGTALSAQASRYEARWGDADAGFALDLQLHTTQPVLLQGQGGISAKSPRPEHHSRYYTQPQLQVQGRLQLQGQMHTVQGRAWLDHEWSSALLDPEAVGWDWVGLNFDDGSALTVFRLRRADGQALFAGGSWRRPGQPVRPFAAHEVRMEPGRLWRSPATAARYPVEWALQTPAGRHLVQAVIDAQELDSRASTGTVYWEGLSRVRDAAGQRVGQGYLEMTGYAGRLSLLG